MRKRLALGIIILLCLTTVAGCQQGSTEPMAPSVNEENPVVITPAPEMEDTILANKTVWGNNDNLYEVSLDCLSGISNAEAYRFGNDLLFVYTQIDQETHRNLYHMTLVGIETGEVLCQQKMEPPLYGAIQIIESGVAVNDLADGRAYLYDQELQPAGEHDLAGGNFAISPAGDTGYQFAFMDGVKKTTLATGESQVVEAGAWDAFLQESNGKNAVYIYVDSETLLRGVGMLDLSTGEITTYDSGYSYLSVEASKESWLGKVETEDSLYVLGDKNGQKQFWTNRNAVVDLNAGSGHIIISEMVEDGETVFSAYDTTGNLVSQCQATGLGSENECDFVWYEEYQGYVFAMDDMAGNAHLMFWDVSADMEGEDLLLEDVMSEEVVSAGIAVAQEYYDRAKQISEKYDVDLLIADQCDTEFVDHTADLLLAEDDVALALDTIDHVLGSYPEGFFTQLKHNTYYEIEIQVLGTLTKASDEEGVSYISGGFVTTAYAGKLLMALDARAGMPGEEVNSILAQTMYHEFSHMIDKRLAFDSMFRADSAYTDYGWTELNPEGFEYNDSYYGTLDGRYADYFVDAYACSNATEDRARTMEYAMAGDIGTFAAKNGLTTKLEYYCQGIRDSFDTTGWPEEAPWEKTLNEVK